MVHAQYQRLTVHVTATNRAVVREAHKLLHPIAARTSAARAARHSWLRSILAEHAAAADTFRMYRL